MLKVSFFCLFHSVVLLDLRHGTCLVENRNRKDKTGVRRNRKIYISRFQMYFGMAASACDMVEIGEFILMRSCFLAQYLNFKLNF